MLDSKTDTSGVVNVDSHSDDVPLVDITNESPAMARALQLVDKAAKRDVPILICGESGTGKELVARRIHNLSNRWRGPFVALNCSAIPDTLLEAELFGHERGAFTGATEARAGAFQRAHRGTLFLDEVADLSLAAQAKVLRALQDGWITRLGAARATHVDARIISATNKDIYQAMSAGHFRADVFWRLNVIAAHLPPLRERMEDLLPLINSIITSHNKRLATRIVGVSAGARRILTTYNWPGNVRELENVLARAMVLAEQRVIMPSDLPASLASSPPSVAMPPALGAVVWPHGTLASIVARAVRDIERSAIQAALVRHNGKKGAVAAALGINRKTLFYKIKTLGINVG
jgi:transcriptional regulator with PAS, ATPase and Fis domain